MINKIETLDELNRFIKSRKSFATEIYFDFPIYSTEQNNELTKKINKYGNACGCETGTIFMCISIILSAIYILMYFSIFKTHILIELLYCLGFVFLCSLSGKFVGLTIAKIKMRSLLMSTKKNITQGVCTIGA